MAAIEDDIVAALGEGRAPTYVIKNRANAGRELGLYTTAQIRRVLRRLEKAGKVAQVHTGYRVMLCWKLA